VTPCVPVACVLSVQAAHAVLAAGTPNPVRKYPEMLPDNNQHAAKPWHGESPCLPFAANRSEDAQDELSVQASTQVQTIADMNVCSRHTQHTSLRAANAK
jgi:hypothetical protein